MLANEVKTTRPLFELDSIISLLGSESNLKSIASNLDEEYKQIFVKELEDKIEKKQETVKHRDFPKVWSSTDEIIEYDYFGTKFFESGYKDVLNSTYELIKYKIPNISGIHSINTSCFEKILTSCDDLLDYIGDTEIVLSSGNVIEPFKEEYINLYIGEIIKFVSVCNENVKSLSNICNEYVDNEYTEKNLNVVSILDRNISNANLNLDKINADNYENLKETILELKSNFSDVKKVVYDAESGIKGTENELKKMSDKGSSYLEKTLEDMNFEITRTPQFISKHFGQQTAAYRT